MPEPIRTLFLIPSLGGGGAERLVSVLLKAIDRDAFRPELALLTEARGPFAAALPPDVPITIISKRHRRDFPLIAWRLAQLLGRRRPNVVVGFMTYANVALLSSRLVSRWKPPVIATEHNHPAFSSRGRKPGARDWLARRMYPAASMLVGVSDGLADALRDRHPRLADRVITIPNPYDPILDTEQSWSSFPGHPWLTGEGPVLVSVGRLIPEKGHADLLRALQIVRQHRDVRLIIAGDGPERTRLVALTEALGVVGAVDFAGYVRDPFALMKGATAFVHPSLSEGMPLVLAEAARCGAAIVATDCDYGPREVIVDGESGILVPPGDPIRLAAGVDRVLADSLLEQRCREGARARSILFSPRLIVDRYQSLMREVALSGAARGQA